MTNEEVRLRAILANRTGDVRYIMDIPRWQQFAGLYPDIMMPFDVGPDGQSDTMVRDAIKGVYLKRKEKQEEALKELKERLDKEFENYDKNR